MKIPGLVYLIIGILMSAFSKLGPNAEQPFLQLFFYVGIVFIFWGVVKMIFAPSKRREKVLQHRAEKGTRDYLCPRCNNQNLSYSRYCHICGYKLM